VLGKLLFKSNLLQLLVTTIKINFLLYVLQKLKSNILQLQLLFKVTKLHLFYIHLDAKCDVNSSILW